MLGEFIEPYLTWKFILIFIILNIFLLYYHFDIVINCLLSQATGQTRYVLVTGCDSGFGYKTALQLNASKIIVFAACLTDQGMKTLTEDATFKGHAIRMDITSDEDVKNVYCTIKKEVRESGLWCVISNAGIVNVGIIDWLTIDEMRKVTDVNLWGAINVIKTMLPLVKISKGRFVNVTSIAGRMSPFGMSAYCMSKFAFEAFSDSLRHEMRSWGITVHIIEPGFFKTSMMNSMYSKWEDIYAKQQENVKKEYGKQFIRRMLENTEQAGVYASPNIKKVTDAICHAALSSNPKLRYVVGWDAWLLWLPVATLPTFIGDFIMRNLSNNPVPDAAKDEKKEKH